MTEGTKGDRSHAKTAPRAGTTSRQRAAEIVARRRANWDDTPKAPERGRGVLRRLARGARKRARTIAARAAAEAARRRRAEMVRPVVEPTLRQKARALLRKAAAVESDRREAIRESRQGRANKGERDRTRGVLVENSRRKGKLACHGGRV